MFATFALILALAFTAQPARAQNWCAASGLNLTERTICADAILGDLDAQLGRAFAAVKTTGETRRQNAWRVGVRDACGNGIACIENTYRLRIDILRALAAPKALRRPWCGAARLNATEQTICGNDVLANLDAAMAAVYGSGAARDNDGEQADWLRKGRDACSGDFSCIFDAYVVRLVALGARLREQ